MFLSLFSGKRKKDFVRKERVKISMYFIKFDKLLRIKTRRIIKLNFCLFGKKRYFGKMYDLGKVYR